MTQQTSACELVLFKRYESKKLSSNGHTPTVKNYSKIIVKSKLNKYEKYK